MPPTSRPSAQGLDAAGLLAFVDALGDHPDIELHGLAIARHGRVAAAVRVVETPHVVHVRGYRGRGEVDLSWRRMPLMGPDPFALAVRRDEPARG